MKLKSTLVACAVVGALTPIQNASAQQLLTSLYPQSCRTQQLVGGGVGALVGGLLGNQVAGKKNKTEGTVLGAVLGGVAGSQIGRIKCENDLKRAMALQLANSGENRVSVPAGPLNRSMSANLRDTYVNEQRQSCKILDFQAAEDGSTPSQSVTACDDGTGTYQIQQA